MNDEFEANLKMKAEIVVSAIQNGKEHLYDQKVDSMIKELRAQYLAGLIKAAEMVENFDGDSHYAISELSAAIRQEIEKVKVKP